MTLTHGYLARGTDVLLKFNAIDKFPSLLTQLSAVDKMTIPGQAHPIVFDNGNIGGDISMDIILKNSTYNTSADWGSTGTIFDQFFEMRRVIYNSGKFLSGKKPAIVDGSKDYDLTSVYNFFILSIFFTSGESQAFSDDFSVFTGDYVRSDRTGIAFFVIPISVSLKSVNQNNTSAIVSVKFEIVSTVYSFRT